MRASCRRSGFGRVAGLANEGPVNAVVQFLAANRASAKAFDLRAVLRRNAAPFLFPLLDGGPRDTKFGGQRLDSHTRGLGRSIKRVIHRAIR